jgi:hypothetical protein
MGVLDGVGWDADAGQSSRRGSSRDFLAEGAELDEHVGMVSQFCVGFLKPFDQLGGGVWGSFHLCFW